MTWHTINYTIFLSQESFKHLFCYTPLILQYLKAFYMILNSNKLKLFRQLFWSFMQKHEKETKLTLVSLFFFTFCIYLSWKVIRMHPTSFGRLWIWRKGSIILLSITKVSIVLLSIPKIYNLKESIHASRWKAWY